MNPFCYPFQILSYEFSSIYIIKHRFVVVYSGVNVSQKVTRLSESTTYKFRILASNEAGTGPYSEDFVFATTKAPPVTLKGRLMNRSGSAG